MQSYYKSLLLNKNYFFKNSTKTLHAFHNQCICRIIRTNKAGLDKLLYICSKFL